MSLAGRIKQRLVALSKSEVVPDPLAKTEVEHEQIVLLHHGDLCLFTVTGLLNTRSLRLSFERLPKARFLGRVDAGNPYLVLQLAGIEDRRRVDISHADNTTDGGPRLTGQPKQKGKYRDLFHQEGHAFLFDVVPSDYSVAQPTKVSEFTSFGMDRHGPITAHLEYIAAVDAK